MNKPSIRYSIHRTIEALRSQKGAAGVEYALSMLLAAWIMIGVMGLFVGMSSDILNAFSLLVTAYP